jgi:MoaA/NifB/PqqE/SkfB family radical SAM enzyme
MRRVPTPTGSVDPQDAPKAFSSACYAPTVSMYFDQFGKVRACCQNTDVPMGDVTRQTIREIWDGAATARMRAALRVADYSEGCGFCQWQVDQGDEEIVFARIFDLHPVHEEHPDWPVQMEFSMTNSCNLQCVMCNGDWSSSIRTHREHRPPLPEVYSEDFFEELAEFLPHLQKANFLGGEPFLGREPLRVLSMLSDLDTPPEVAVTTNGTQWSPRIERICERLPISFVLSLDGITKSTYESIRIGADFDIVMANLDRFQDTARRHGTVVTLAHCLMRPNWHEFSQLLRFAEDRELDVGMNEVLFPVELSLFQLPAAELRSVVATMEQDPGGIAASLDRLRPVWDGQVAALRHRLEALERGTAVLVRPWGDPAEPWEERATRILTEWVGDRAPIRLVIGAPIVTSTEHDTVVERFGLDQATSAEDVVARLAALFEAPDERSSGSADLLHDVVLGQEGPDHPMQFRVSWDDSVDRTTVLVAVRNPPPPPVLPADPLAVLTAWCGADNVIVLTCDADEVITGTDGDLGLLLPGDDHDPVGSTTTGLIGRLESELGAFELAPGPSGFVADSLVTFVGPTDRPALRLRVMVERRSDDVTMMIGICSAPGEDIRALHNDDPTRSTDP